MNVEYDVCATNVTAGDDATICESDLPFTLSTANAETYTAVIWTTDGTGVFNDSSLVSPVYTPSGSDIEDVQVRLTMHVYGEGNCAVQTDEMVLTIWQQATVYAGRDTAVCDNEPYYVDDAHATNYTDISWSENGTGYLLNATTLAPTYVPGLNETGLVELTVTATAIGSCGVVTDNMFITYGPCSVIANNDTSLTNIPGNNVVIDVLANDELFDGSTPDPGNVSVDLDPNTSGIQTSITVAGEGEWTYNDATGEVTFNPEDGFTTDPTPITYVLTETSTGLSDDAVIYVGYDEQPPIAVNDTLTGNTPGDAALVNILANDTLSDGSQAAPDNTSVVLIDPVTGNPTITENVVVVEGEGTWTYDPATGDLTFTPEPGFTDDPTALEYELTETLTGLTDTAEVTLIYDDDDPIATNDISTGNLPGDATTLTILSNDSLSDGTTPTVDNSTITLIDPGTNLPTTTPDTVTVAGEGQWVYDDTTGELTFTPEAGFTGDPTDITYILTDNGTGGTDTATVNVEYDVCATNVTAGDDITICETALPYELITANAETYQSVLWSTDGTGTFDNPTVLCAVYNPSPDDIEDVQVILTMTVTGEGNCPVETDEMVLSIWQDPSADAGIDATICEGENFTLTAATALNYDSLLWETDGSGTFDNANALNPIYFPSTDDVNDGEIVLSLTATPVGICDAAQSDLTLTILPSAVADAGADATICETEDYYVMDGSIENSSLYIWSSSGSGTFDDPFDLNTNYYPSTADKLDGQVNIWLIAFGEGDCGSANDMMVLSVSQQPAVSAGPDATLCEGEVWDMCCTTAENYTSLLWETSGTGTFDDPTALRPTYTPSAADVLNGSVILTINAYAEDPCSDVSDSRILTIVPVVIADAGSDQTFTGTNTIMDGNDPAPGTGLWTQVNGPNIATITNPTDHDTEITGLVSGTYVFRWTITNEPCGETWDEMTIVVEEIADLELTKSVTPEQTITAGEDLTYSIVVKNLGPDHAENVVVTDILPDQLSLVSAAPTKGIWNDPVWTIGSLPFGDVETITIVATVEQGFTGLINNIAVVTSDTPDSDLENNTDSAQIYVYIPPVAVNDSSIGNYPGNDAVLNILTNDLLADGSTPAPGEVIVDLDPYTDGIQHELIVIGEGTWTYDPVTGTLTFSPEPEFLDDPSPIDYEITEILTGLTSNVADVYVTYICLTIDVQAFLEGPFDETTGLMYNYINNAGLLPGEEPLPPVTPTPAGQPYDAEPWNYDDLSCNWYGDPSVNPEATTPYPDDVVDWVLVSVRQGDSLKSSEIFRCVGLIYRDGQIELECPCFRTAGVDKYYILVEHRNHFPVMSEVVHLNGGTALSYDFRYNDSWKLGTPIPQEAGQKQIGSYWVMLGGNGDQQLNLSSPFDINSIDFEVWTDHNGQVFRYLIGDFDMNLDANSLDDELWINNNGKINFIPR